MISGKATAVCFRRLPNGTVEEMTVGHQLSASSSQLSNLHQKSAEDFWSEQLWHQALEGKFNCLWYVYDFEINDLIAVAQTWNLFDEAELQQIFVLPEYRGQGVATALLSAIIQKLTLSGTSKLMLEAKSTNRFAVNLYRKLSFLTVSVRKNYYRGTTGQKVDAILMELALKRQ